MKYKCIIFDCDGVLVDSVEISFRVLEEMTADLGIDVNELQIREAFAGNSLQSIFEFIENNMDGQLPPNFESIYRNRTFERFEKELRPIEGIPGLLDKLKIPYCIASGGPRNKILLNLTITGLLDKIGDNIFSSFDIGSWKPEPDIFLHAAKQMGFKPHECAVIEDSISGIQAAVKGGFDAFGFATKVSEQEMIALGAKTFFNMDELFDMLSI